MLKVDGLAELRGTLDAWTRAGDCVALVPTMGGLHAGHMALIERAQQVSRRVVVSIYVNPRQFGEGEDLERYPRPLESDLNKLEAAACDLLWMPSDATMYPSASDATISLLLPHRLTDTLEGEFRPGHFNGVASVVARLFNQVRPDKAVFGEKDYQQLTLVRHMVRDLGYPIAVEPVPTVRESDGLAMSSRNVYLEGSDRELAPLLHQVMEETADNIRQTLQPFADLEARARAHLDAEGFKTEYFAIRRSENLCRPAEIDRRNSAGTGPDGLAPEALRILAAAWCGPTRLIDNIFVA